MELKGINKILLAIQTVRNSTMLVVVNWDAGFSANYTLPSNVVLATSTGGRKPSTATSSCRKGEWLSH